MAKKKAVRTATTKRMRTAPDVRTPIGADSLFTAMKDASAISRPDGVFTGNEARCSNIGVTLPYFSQRYIFQNDCLPLGRMIHIKGLTECMKSGLTFEMFNWHLDIQGGGAIYLPTEGRDQTELRASTIGEDRMGSIRVEVPEKLEEWQDVGVFWIKRLAAEYGEDGPSFPLCLAVDSVTGVGCASSVDSVMDDGHASVNFAIEANLINRYTKVYTQQLQGLPLTFICTNHMKVSKDFRGNNVFRTPGGDALRFYSSFELELTRLVDYKSVSEAGRQIHIKVTKNSMGDGRQEMVVDVIWWFDANEKQITIWDWAAASIDFLLQLHGLKKSAPETWRKHIASIVDLETTSNGKRVSSKTLGVTKTTFHDAGEALEANKDVREALDKLFRIHKVRPFAPGVPFGKQLDAARHEEEALRKELAATSRKSKTETKAEPELEPTTELALEPEKAEELADGAA